LQCVASSNLQTFVALQLPRSPDKRHDLMARFQRSPYDFLPSPSSGSEYRKLHAFTWVPRVVECFSRV
jgi:hypothetical protein